MVRELFIGPHGSEDPTKATFTFLMASGALDAGHEPAIILSGDAVVLMNDAVVDSVQGIGFPPLRELVDKIVQNKVPIYV
jgi:predicted peroxiredoxin